MAVWTEEQLERFREAHDKCDPVARRVLKLIAPEAFTPDPKKETVCVGDWVEIPDWGKYVVANLGHGYNLINLKYGTRRSDDHSSLQELSDEIRRLGGRAIKKTIP